MMRQMLCTALFCLIATTLSGQEPKQTVTPKDWVMRPEAATAYQKNRVQPLLQKAIEDATYPIGITNRIKLLFTGVQNNQILYQASPFYFPRSKTILAHIDYDPQQDKPLLMVFVPSIIDLEKEFVRKGYPRTGFELELAIAFAHEYIHVELAAKYPFRLRAVSAVDAKEEAHAWGITILEMVRPALQQNRWLQPSFRLTSDEFKKVGDNYNHPAWIAAFANYHGR